MKLAVSGPTLIFDGVCHLCNGAMDWFQIRCGPRPVWYMWCQHEDARALMTDYAVSSDDLLQSWAFLEDGVVYRGWTAWLRAVRYLKRPWCYLSLLEHIVPLSIRETAYNFIRRNRYRMFGKSEVRKRPNKLLMSRMIHSLDVAEDRDAKSKEVPPQPRKRLLVIGCGPAGIMVAKAMHRRYSTTVMEPKDFFEFTPGVLRGLVAESEMSRLVCPLKPVLVDQFGVSLIQGRVTDLNAHVAVVKCRDRTMEVGFDFCVVASGSSYPSAPLSKIPSCPIDGNENAVDTTGRLEKMAQERNKLQEMNSKRNGRICIVGGGLVGVELAAELCENYPNVPPFHWPHDKGNYSIAASVARARVCLALAIVSRDFRRTGGVNAGH